MSNALRKMQKDKYITKMTETDFKRMEVIARQHARELEKKVKDEFYDDAFWHNMAVVLNVLLTEYWPKATKNKILMFCEQCRSLHESCRAGVVSGEDLIGILDEYQVVRHRERDENNE